MADRDALIAQLRSKTRYDPAEVEPRVARRWLESGLFHPEPEGNALQNYSIAIPPPNVTGSLHMGHAFQDAIMDTLIRHHRMRGQRTKWILGTDHAGIATQAQVEQALRAEGTTREALGRVAFERRVWEWREQYGGTIIEQLKRLGASCDYDDERFTLDPDYAAAVLGVFVALYEKGYIYRDRYMVNWDPGTRSAISDLEVEDREVTDTLYYIEYPLADGEGAGGAGGAITVATVRPETMLADAAVAVHPDDERHSRLLGREAILPLVGRRLPIIADDYVKPEFGTGVLKITPGHDPNDFEIGRRHGLEQISVIGEDGRITDVAPERFVGMTAAEAQRAVVAELQQQGLILRTEEHLHTVPFSQRSGERIEPLISLQWFMAMEELAAPAIEAVRSGRVTFHPRREATVYLNWMENIRPWCISRQLWWGHQIPVWYRGEEVYVGTSAPDGEGWERDPDVLDTWFSSALWPFAALGWPQRTPELDAFYPTDALVTARDIIFLWVARMVMMGLEFTGRAPFSDVHIHAIIQAPDGRRMSKSLGTGIDPMGLIEGGPRPPVFDQLDDAGAAQSGSRMTRAPADPARLDAERPASASVRRVGGKPAGSFPAYGADALRWGLLAMSSTQDVKFSEDKIAQGLQLANKLWNASRLILLGVGPEARPARVPGTLEDRWILSRLERAREDVNGRIERYDFSHAALALYYFIYAELCDWYLELVKPRLRAGEETLQATLLYILTETLTLAHPMIPFVTEEIYGYIPGSEGLLAARRAPAGAGPLDDQAEAALGRVIEAVQAIRGWRAQAEVRAGANLPARLAAGGYEETQAHLALLGRLQFTEDGAEPLASVPVPGGAVEILAGAEVDLEAAREKLQAQRARLEHEIERSRAKLANEGFVAKAPPHIVQAERDKLARLDAELEAL